MNIVFVGSVVDANELKKLTAASVAGNKMQLGIVEGLVENGGQIKVISVEPFEARIFNSSPIFVRAKAMKTGTIVINTISYCNFPIIKQVSIFCNLLKKLVQIVSDEETILMVYNTMSFFALPVILVSKFRKSKRVAIVADLPIKQKKCFLREIEDIVQIKLIKKFDAIIPITKHIHNDFAPSIPYQVIEAGSNPNDYACISQVEEIFEKGKHHIVFSGTLNSLSGLELLIDAMNFVIDEVVLHIFGNGPSKHLLLKKIENNHSIIYHGVVSNDEMLKIQSNADALVCPRMEDGFTTKYTFPSKIIEYLCSGVPVIANRLQGIPDEYENYVNFVKDESAQEWGKLINEVLIINKSYYRKKSEKARQIILSEKNWKNQCKKIMIFLKTL